MQLRFGLIGLGHHGRKAVAPAFREPDCAGGRLCAVSDVRQEALDAFDLPVEGSYTDYRRMLADAGLDAVYVAAGMDRHYTIVMDAIASGKHVIVEKPMAGTSGECRRMTDAAAAAGIALAVNFEKRYGEHNVVLRRWIDEGCFGRLEALHFSMMWDGHKSFGPVRERRARLMELCGALDCGIHELDQARYLAGGRWAEILARGAWMGEEFTPPTHIGIVGQLDSGVLVTLNASLSWAAHIEPRPMIDTLEIAGTEGVAVGRSSYDLKRTELELYSRTRTERRTIDRQGHTRDIVHVINDFADVVENGWSAAIRLARGEDGFQAQWATEQANGQAIRSRIKRGG